MKESVWEFLKTGPLKVAILGSGNWGSAIAKIVGHNAKKTFFFQDTVPMYVFEENYNGRKLTEVINETHENPKYLPGIKLPENIVATPNIREAVKDAHVLVFVMPHQVNAWSDFVGTLHVCGFLWSFVERSSYGL